MQLPILLIPEKVDIEREQVFKTWINRGGTIQRLGKYWIKDENLANKPLALYGNGCSAEKVIDCIINATEKANNL